MCHFSETVIKRLILYSPIWESIKLSVMKPISAHFRLLLTFS